MKNDDLNNSKDSDTELRLAVPKNMRTRPQLARTLATIAIVICSALYITGLRAITSVNEDEQNILGDFLQIGLHHWNIIPPSDTSTCVGFIHTQLKDVDKIEFTTDGELLVPLYGKPLLVKFSAKAIFNENRQLEFLNLHGTSGKLSLDLITPKDDSTHLEITASTQSQSRSMNITRPHPIYLAKIGETSYSLGLPKRFQVLLNTRAHRTSKSIRKSFLRTSDTSGEIDCKNQIKKAKANPKSLSRLPDIGKYLDMFNTKANKDIFDSLKQG